MDSFGICAQELYIVLCKESALSKLHGKGKTCLTAESGKNAVGLFYFDYLLYNVKCKGFDVNLVCHCLIGHDGSRVGVDEDYLQTLLLEGTAGLCACVVKLGCLTDDDRT